MARMPSRTPEWVNYNEVDPGTADGGHDNWIPIQSISQPIYQPGGGSSAAKGGHNDWIPIQSISQSVHRSSAGSESAFEIKVWADPTQARALAPGNRYVELKLRDPMGNKVALRGAQLLAVRDIDATKSLTSKGGRTQMMQEWSIVYETIQRVS